MALNGGFGFNVALTGASNVVSGFKGIGSSIGGVTIALTAMTAAVGKGLAEFSTFEAEISKLEAISGLWDRTRFSVEEATRAQEAFTNKALELGSTTAFTASQAAEGMQFLAMAGFEANQTLAAIGPTLSLAAATATDLGRTADIMSDVMQGMGLSAEEAGRAVDVLALTTSMSNTNLEQLGQAMSFVAPVASQLGVTIEQTAAAIGAMSDAGIKSTRAGTALRSTLVRLSAPNKKVTAALKELKVEVKDSGDNFRDFQDIMGDLNKAMSGLTNTQKVQKAEAIAGRFAMTGFLEMVKQAAPDIEGMLKPLVRGSQESTDALNKLGIQFRDLNTSAMLPLDSIVKQVAGKFKNMSHAARVELVNSMARSSEEAEKLFKALEEVSNGAEISSGKLDRLTNALNGAAGAAEEMSKTQLANLRGDMTIMKSAVEGAAISVGGVFAPAARVGALAINVFATGINKFAKLVGESFLDANKGVIGFRDKLEAGLKAFNILTGKVQVDFGSAIFKDYAKSIGLSNKQLSRMSDEELAKVAQGFANSDFAAKQLTDSITKNKDIMEVLGIEGVMNVQKIAKEWDIFKVKFKKAMAIVIPIVMKVFGFVFTIVKNVVGFISDAIGGFISGFSKFFDPIAKAFSSIIEVITRIIEKVSSLFKGIGKGGKQINIISGLFNVLGRVAGFVLDNVLFLIEQVVIGIEFMVDAIVTTINKIKEWVAENPQLANLIGIVGGIGLGVVALVLVLPKAIALVKLLGLATLNFANILRNKFVIIGLVIGAIVLLIAHWEEVKALWISLSAPLKILLVIVGAIITAFAIWRLVQIALNLVMMANPIILIMIGVIVLVTALILFWKSLAKTAIAVWETIKDFFVFLGDILAGSGLAVAAWAVNLTASVVSFIEDAVTRFKVWMDFIRFVVDNIAQAFKIGFQAVKLLVLTVLDFMVNKIIAFANTLTGVLTSIADLLGFEIDLSIDKVDFGVKEAQADLDSLTSAQIEPAKGFDELRKGVDFGSKALTQTGADLQKQADGFFNKATIMNDSTKDLWSGVGDQFVADASAAGDKFSSLIPSFAGTPGADGEDGDRKFGFDFPGKDDRDGKGDEIADHLNNIQNIQKEDAKNQRTRDQKGLKVSNIDEAKTEIGPTNITLNQNIDTQKQRKLFILDQSVRTFATTV